MKLSYEDKLNIYDKKKQGVTWDALSREYKVRINNLKYLVKLMDRYGFEVVKPRERRYYSPELKQEIMNRVLIDGRSQLQTSLDYGLPGCGLLSSWLAKHKQNRYTIVENTTRSTANMGRKPKKTWDDMSEIERLQEENERLRTEVTYLKKMRKSG